MQLKITIRQECYEDYKETEAVVKHAFTNMEFSDQTEHKLVARIRKSGVFIPELSLVAVDSWSYSLIKKLQLKEMKQLSNHWHLHQFLFFLSISTKE